MSPGLCAVSSGRSVPGRSAPEALEDSAARFALSEIKAARKASDAKRARDAPDGFRLRNKMARAARRALPEIKAARKALDAKSLSKQHQALPVHVRTRVGEAAAEAASLSIAPLYISKHGQCLGGHLELAPRLLRAVWVIARFHAMALRI